MRDVIEDARNSSDGMVVTAQSAGTFFCGGSHLGQACGNNFTEPNSENQIRGQDTLSLNSTPVLRAGRASVQLAKG